MSVPPNDPTDLPSLLAGLQPELDEVDYVFLSIPHGAEHPFVHPAATCHEAEGLTLVVPASRAEAAGFPVSLKLRRITLTVHSSLEAVGLTAAVASRLAEVGIPANVIAAFYHDHVFVPADRAGEALGALKSLSRTAK
ncbi:MAG: ACT domain-containing protein [Bacteroidota bacterium]